MSRWIAGLLCVGFVGMGTLRAHEPAPAQPASTVAAPLTTSGACCQPWYQQGCDQGCGLNGSLVAGIGFSYVRPHFNNNPAFTLSFVDGGVSHTRQFDFTWDREFGCSAWLGYVCCDGFGGRIRATKFDDDAESASVTVQPSQTVFTANSYLNAGISSSTPGDVFSFTSSLKLEVWDFEMTQNLRCWGANIIVAAGVRYARVDQTYTADHTGLTEGELDVSHNFKGIGPTFALEGFYNLSSGLAIYGNGRASLLYGDYRYESYYVGRIMYPYPPTQEETELNIDCLLAILEAEIGIEAWTAIGGSRLFAQLGIRGDFWVGGNNASRAAGSDVDDLSITDFGLIGFMLRLGLDY
jgi:hypothetical protein